ncbi:magnesium/cobalt transporter CorA [Flavobacterium okayamense]|uniref:Magnesium transport protein CorA n=1 Tax=Flavobacterium okayamense TaxID=2830782 RepID=A0ABM7S6R0_9FLAO|nr:magnesium/cobalt transporter CorA [Flavobacterium okayamense]BCY29212.1 magnesium transport protein CorA [Flavobacterium okayamense]
MRKIRYKKGRKVQGQTYEYTGIYTDKQTEMQLFVYNEQEVDEYEKVTLEEFSSKRSVEKNNWLNIHGLTNIDLIKSLAENLELNSLIISDILNIARGTRLDEMDESLFFSIKSILPNESDDTIRIEQISFLIKENLIVSFQEKRGDFFTHIRERLRTNSGVVRKKHVDYLLYLLLDAIIENFYITIENKETKIELLLATSKTSDDPKVVEEIEHLREIFHYLKRSLIPLKEALYTIKTIKDDDEFNSIQSSNFVFFSRLHQKTIELLEQIDYDMTSLDSASNFYYTTQNHKMNEVMKTLTVISSVFLPLTFIAGIYGMNFKYMPELNYHYGYYTIIGLMFLIVIVMLIYFKRKNWF